MSRVLIHATWLVAGLTVPLSAETPQSEVNGAAVRTAISRAVPLLEKASAGSVSHDKCFSCHSQAIPVLALQKSRQLGFTVDSEHLTRLVSHTLAHLERGQQKYAEGVGQGGRVVTAGYALWTLHASGHSADKVTRTVSTFLLRDQQQNNHWEQNSQRPPSSGSPFMTSYVAVKGLMEFGSQEHQERIEERRTAVSDWIGTTEACDTEDHVFRLRLASLTESVPSQVPQYIQDLLSLQRPDGGWGQFPEAEPDAYATGTALAALLETDSSLALSEATNRAVDWLLRKQLEDGSWHVVTRAEGFQEYFESGFPHGVDQFISTSASAWSTLALLHFLDFSSRQPSPENQQRGGDQ